VSLFVRRCQCACCPTLEELQTVIDEELDRLARDAPERREMTRVVNQLETGFLEGLEDIGNMADNLNRYAYYTGNPDFFNEDLSRYKALAPNDLSAFVRIHLDTDNRVLLSIVPEGQTGLAVPPVVGETPAGD